MAFIFLSIPSVYRVKPKTPLKCFRKFLNLLQNLFLGSVLALGGRQLAQRLLWSEGNRAAFGLFPACSVLTASVGSQNCEACIQEPCWTVVKAHVRHTESKTSKGRFSPTVLLTMSKFLRKWLFFRDFTSHSLDREPQVTYYCKAESLFHWISCVFCSLVLIHKA